MINNTACIAGNSSTALRDRAFLGVPAVNIGTRQEGRENGQNVIHVGYDAKEIEMNFRKQIDHGKYEGSTLFWDGHAGKRIAKILAEEDVKIQKKLYYLRTP